MLAALVAAAALMGGCASEPPEQPEAVADPGRALLARGVRAYAAGEYEAAATDFTNALHYYRSYDLAGGMVRSRINLARIDLALGNVGSADGHVRAAARLRGRLETPALRARLDLMVSNVALELGETDRAARAVEGHLPAFDPDNALAGDLDGLDRRQASFVANRTAIAFARDEPAAADWVERLAGTLEQLTEPAPALSGRLHRFRARLARQRGEPDRALEWLDRGLRAYKRARNASGIAQTLEATAAVHAAQGRPATARDYLDRALYTHIARRNERGARTNLRQRAALLDTDAERREALERWLERLETGQPPWGELRRALID